MIIHRLNIFFWKKKMGGRERSRQSWRSLRWQSWQTRAELKRLLCRVIRPILWNLSLICVVAAVTVVTSQVPCYLFEWCNLLFLSFLLYRYWVTHVWFSLQLRGHSCYWSALSFKATCFEGTWSRLVTLSIRFILLIYESRLMRVLKSNKKAGFTTSCLGKYKPKPSDYGKDKQIP